MTTKQVDSDSVTEQVVPPKTCLFCGAILNDKRRTFCKGTDCKKRYNDGEVPPEAQQSSWSMQSVNSDPPPSLPDLSSDPDPSDTKPEPKKKKKKSSKKKAKDKEQQSSKDLDEESSEADQTEDAGASNGGIDPEKKVKPSIAIDGGNVVSMSDLEAKVKQEMGLRPEDKFPPYNPQPSLADRSLYPSSSRPVRADYPEVPYIGPSATSSYTKNSYDDYLNNYDPDDEFVGDEAVDGYEDDMENEADDEDVDYEDKAALTYESYRKDPSIFTAGETYIETFYFDGDFSQEFDGNFNSSKWVPALERIWDSLPVERLIGALEYEYGGGAFLIQFMRTGLKSPRKAKPPIVLRIKEDPMKPNRNREEEYERNKERDLLLERDRNLLLEERRRAHEAQSVVMDQRRAQYERERDATSQMFKMQEKLLDQQNQKEARLMQEIKDLREKDDSPAVVRFMEEQLAALREERRNMELQQQELRNVIQDKDQMLFKMILEERKEAEAERREERKRQEESQNELAKIIAERDAKFMSALSDLRDARENGGGNDNNLLEIVMTLNHQTTKTEEMRAIQMAEERRRQEKADELRAMQMAEERKRYEEAQMQHSRDMMMMMQTIASNSAGDGNKDQAALEARLEKIQERYERQLEQSRQDSMRLQEKIFELKMQPPPPPPVIPEPPAPPASDDKFERLLMQQNDLTRQELMEARKESKELMSKLFDTSHQNKDANSMKAFLESANVFKQAKEAVSEVFELATEAPEPVVSGPVVPDKGSFDNYIEKATDLARAFNVGSLFDALGQRLASGGKTEATPSSLRPPSIPPPAGIYQPSGFPAANPSVSQIPPAQPHTINATTPPSTPPPVSTPTPQPQPQPVSPQPQAPQQQYVSYDQTAQMAGQPAAPVEVPGQTQGAQPSGYGVTEYGTMLVNLIESAISSGTTPEDFVGQLPVSQLGPLKDISKEDLVASINEITDSVIIKTLRGRRWIESAYDVIQTKLKAAS